MKKFFAFLALPLVAFAAFSCDKNEPVEEPVKYALSVDSGSFVNNKANIFVKADKAASQDVVINILLDEESTLPAAALTYPATLTIPGGALDASGEVVLDPQKLEPGDYKAVFSAKVGETALADKATITYGKANLNGAWSIIGSFEASQWKYDIVMTEASDGWYVAENVIANEIDDAREFKFRRDGKWDLAYGLEATAAAPLDQEFSVCKADGENTNIKLERSGIYTISFNPNKGLAKVVRTGAAPLIIDTLKRILATGTQSNPATFEGYVSNVVVTQVSGKNAYVEDASAGILLYGDWVVAAGLAAGYKLTGEIAGKGYLFKDHTPEVTEITSDLTKLTVEPVAELPCSGMTISGLLESFDNFTSQRIYLSDVKNTEKDLAKGDNMITDRSGAEIDLYLNQTPAITVEKGSTFDVTGIAVYYNDTKELKIWADNAIEDVIPPTKVTRLTRVWGKYPGDSGSGSVWTSGLSSINAGIVGNDRTMAADDKYVYVAAAGTDVSGVVAIDIKNGVTAKAVNMTGVEGGFFPTACVRTIYDPAGKKWILLVGSMGYASEAKTDWTFNVYAYTNGIDAAPTKVISWNANGRRVGDFFNVVGDWSKGEIWCRANGTTHAFMWPITNGTIGSIVGTAEMGYSPGSVGMGQIYKYDVDAKQALLVTPTIGRFYAYTTPINFAQAGVDWAGSDNSAFAKLFGIKPFEFGGKKYIAYVRKLDARRSKLEIIEDKGSAANFQASIEENTVQNRYIFARPVQNKNDNAKTDEEFRAILDAGDGSIANQEMSNCSVVPVEDGVLIVAHHYRVGVVVFKMTQELAE